jgi:hypothetical protein
MDVGPKRAVKAMFVGGRGFSLSGHRGALKKLGGPLRQILLQGLEHGIRLLIRLVLIGSRSEAGEEHPPVS